MKRFLPWLLPIAILLIGVPALLMLKVVAFAKIAGVIMVVLTTVAIRFWLYNANKLRTKGAKVKFTINERYFLNEHFPLYKSLSAKDRNALEERAGLLLAEISFDRFDRKDAGKDECLALAMLLSVHVYTLPYKSAEGKIVVFKEDATAEIGFQSEKPVLFVSESEVKDRLAQLKQLYFTSDNTDRFQQILHEFYSI
ncbi:MAG: hypothetical protein HYZ43_13320 [Flavobacteriia bacterium]|nr:hypothetical protein [Flavobacteriia bacterium]